MKTVQNLIKQTPAAFAFETKFETLSPFLREHPFSHFPIVENNTYMGSLAVVDINPLSSKSIIDYRYALQPFFVRKDATWFEILEKFAQFDCNILAVLNKNNQYIGYYYYNDVLSFLNKTPFLKETGLALVVEKHYLDYSISEIAQIVESNNSKLLGIFISSIENQMAQVTIKASAGNINEIIQTFRRFGYEIISEHNQDTYLNELKDRSAYLDKYLNI